MKTLSTARSTLQWSGEPTTILGIDPGSRKMGYGVVELLPRSGYVYRECGVITANVKAPLHERLVELGEGLTSLLSEYDIAFAAVEDIFVGMNIQSAFVLGQARGMVLYLLGTKGIDITAYAPTLVKKYIGGSGRAPKDQVRRSVSLLTGLTTLPAEDAADALALAVCHAMHLRLSLKGVP
ncbi:crossover junction endodeoxyribonuclease RuvC [Myxococcota bacterium]|nr:crossover junction endodeoxyribonuclease RuvC [Myxococcota bacterium]